MLLELGIAIAQPFLARELDREHDWFLLVPKAHQYLKFASDLAAFDPKTYDGSVADIVSNAMLWLVTRRETREAPTTRQVLAALPDFQAAKKQLVEEWSEDVPWADIVKATLECNPARK